MKSCPAAGYQVDDAAERLGDTRPNPHGGEDDLSSNQTAAILQNTSTDIAADLRGRFTLFLLSPLSRNRASDSFSSSFRLSPPAAKTTSFSYSSREKENYPASASPWALHLAKDSLEDRTLLTPARLPLLLLHVQEGTRILLLHQLFPGFLLQTPNP